MFKSRSLATLAAGACLATVTLTGCSPAPEAPAAPDPLPLGSSAGFAGLLTSSLLYVAADRDTDGVVTRDELTATMEGWLTSAGDAEAGVTVEELTAALDSAMPLSGLAAMFNMGGGDQPTTPVPATVEAMMQALPATAPAEPREQRHVLVLARAGGFVHSSIPLAAATIEALGDRTGAWTTTISYDAADINAENLEQYDAIFLASTTGAFLDDPDDPAVTRARRQALLDFVRGGKGLAGIHAATDSYHSDSAPPPAEAGANPLASLLEGISAGRALAPVLMSQGDADGDGRLTGDEMSVLADRWFVTLDARGSGRLLQADVALAATMIPQPAGAAAPPVPQGPDTQVGTWPDFNRMIGGFFKFHWLDPQLITVKIDDPASPLTAMFHGQPFEVRDEIYTMGAASFSRDQVRVLTSIDYDSMSAEDRALEDHPRADHDHGISWIRRDGDGRVFYLALGHSERIYAITPVLEHLLAGMQYALGDLDADDTPVP